MHLVGLVAAVAVVALCSLLPFLPGHYDNLAMPLSGIAQVIGTVGLLPVPFAALLLFVERTPSLARWRMPVMVLTVIAAGLVWILMSLGALVYSGISLATITASVGILAALRIRRSAAPLAFPLYLVVVPIVTATLQWTVVAQAIDSSRIRTMANAAPLIAAIEAHRAANGRYPVSLLSEGPDFLPNTIGVERYWYEPHFDSYNLVFEQFTYQFGTREFVVYNPLDQQVFTAHASDRLTLTPAQMTLEWQRGHYEAVLAALPHWKIFRFD